MSDFDHVGRPAARNRPPAGQKTAGEGPCGSCGEECSASDPAALLGRGQDPHRAGSLRGEDSIAELSRKEGIAQSLYYTWSKEFMEAGKRRLGGDTAHAAATGEVQDLRREARA